MEKTKLQLAKIKAAQLLKFFTEKSNENFESVKIKDSEDLVEYSELVVGTPVSISSSTGSTPAPDGTRNLVNDVVLVVKDGLVESFEKPVEEEAKDEVKVEELAVEEEVAVVEDTKSEDVKALEDKVAKLEEMVATMMEIIDMQPSKEDVAEFNSKVEKLSKVPTQVSADTRVELQESQLDKAKRLADQYTKK